VTAAAPRVRFGIEPTRTRPRPSTTKPRPKPGLACVLAEGGFRSRLEPRGSLRESSNSAWHSSRTARRLGPPHNKRRTAQRSRGWSVRCGRAACLRPRPASAVRPIGAHDRRPVRCDCSAAPVPPVPDSPRTSRSNPSRDTTGVPRSDLTLGSGRSRRAAPELPLGSCGSGMPRYVGPWLPRRRPSTDAATVASPSVRRLSAHSGRYASYGSLEAVAGGALLATRERQR
jgi:hypothetical protein